MLCLVQGDSFHNRPKLNLPEESESANRSENVLRLTQTLEVYSNTGLGSGGWRGSLALLSKCSLSTGYYIILAIGKRHDSGGYVYWSWLTGGYRDDSVNMVQRVS